MGEFLTIFPAVLEISPPTVGGPHPMVARVNRAACQLPDNLTILLPPVLAIIRRHLVFFWRYVWLYLSTLKG